MVDATVDAPPRRDLRQELERPPDRVRRRADPAARPFVTTADVHGRS